MKIILAAVMAGTTVFSALTLADEDLGGWKPKYGPDSPYTKQAIEDIRIYNLEHPGRSRSLTPSERIENQLEEEFSQGLRDLKIELKPEDRPTGQWTKW